MFRPLEQTQSPEAPSAYAAFSVGMKGSVFRDSRMKTKHPKLQGPEIAIVFLGFLKPHAPIHRKLRPVNEAALLNYVQI